MKPKGITIHNTGNELSARENYRMLKKAGNLNLCHFLVDEKEVVKTHSIKKPAFHTGKGFDLGNMNTIAIEICRSYDDLCVYMQAEMKAVELIKELMAKYSITKDNIYFHRDFDDRAYCPHRLLDIYKTKKNFINTYFKEGE